jgi:hypothetical protein
MFPSAKTRLQRIKRCASDLAGHGIRLKSAGRREIGQLIRRHLDYFQLMLGYDAAPMEIIALVERLRSPGHTKRAWQGARRRGSALQCRTPEIS